MPRSNWKGIISFGLVSIPVMLYPAENKSADISFHQIDKRDNARIKYQRVNANTGKIVPWEQITRGYEYDENKMIPVPDDLLKKIVGENGRTIDIETFISSKELSMLQINHFYYLVPDKRGEKGYVILRDALNETQEIGIAKVIISTREYLAAVMPYEKALILCLLKYDEEVRKLTEFDLPAKEKSSYKINKKEMDVAKKLIKSMTDKWQPKKYHDEYQQKVHKWVQEEVNKVPHTKVKQRAHTKEDKLNFIDLLKKSLASSATKHVNKNKTVTTRSPRVVRTKAVKHASKH